MEISVNKLLLVILDGWGWRDQAPDNAISQAHKPNFDYLWKNFPHTLLQASGQFVGLPKGQIGSSEVGHTIIGAGRNVPQLSTTITNAIHSRVFFQNPVLKSAFEHVKKRNSKLHILGLTSDGGVHSYFEHPMALVQMAGREGLRSDQVCFHAILDGRDVGPKTAKAYLIRLQSELGKIGIGHIATISGRYWTMDRDKRWERIAKAYHALVLGEGAKSRDPVAAVGDNYFAGKTDEFVEPTIIYKAADKPVGLIADGDAVIFFNFRPDRARQIVLALTDKNFREFERKKVPDIYLVCMTSYDATLKLPIAFPPDLTNQGKRLLNLAESLEELALPQLRIAETEKYAHVTYFFNGGQEKPYHHEERVLIPSPKVPTYDEMPEMSARLITDALIQRLSDFTFSVCNFANTDMVGHTGIFEAAKHACEVVDECLGRILKEAEKLGVSLFVTADHGNSEQMNDELGGPHTAHTTNPVPFIFVNPQKTSLALKKSPDLSLRDIAPTAWELLVPERPHPFEGQSLLSL